MVDGNKAKISSRLHTGGCDDGGGCFGRVVAVYARMRMRTYRGQRRLLMVFSVKGGNGGQNGRRGNQCDEGVKQVHREAVRKKASRRRVIKMFWKMKEKRVRVKRQKYRRGKFWWCVTMTVRCPRPAGGERASHRARASLLERAGLRAG